ncbi:hypothetical protein [Amycolatopsis benzoatilytica]|uniref:hypothetical protein n=1 Tax=Amycolatopsis benzoatilytica TaxID=346045 RepID=UPI000373C762|nr:hypothetical protein [Amycolatopsis benzoatilytica]
MTARIAGQLPADEVAAATYAVHRWAKDGRNHRFDRELFYPGAEVFWPKCTRGKRVPQRTCFASELSAELGDDRDRAEDCRTCFWTGPRGPRQVWW